MPGADPRTEVGQLAEAVNTMLVAVENEYIARYESEQRLRRFLADASHELRTPLTSLRGYAELVRLRGGLDEDASDSLRRIETEGKRMGGLVDDLLTLARSDRGTVVERVPVDVADVVDDAVGACGPRTRSGRSRSAGTSRCRCWATATSSCRWSPTSSATPRCTRPRRSRSGSTPAGRGRPSSSG